MILHQFRFAINDKEEESFEYLDDIKEVKILEKIYSKTLIEKMGLLIWIPIILTVYYNYDYSFKDKTIKYLFFIIVGLLVVSCIKLVINWFKCIGGIEDTEISEGYLNWILIKRASKFTIIALYLNSILMFVGQKVEGIESSIKILTPEGSFFIASIITIIALIVGIIVNSTRSKFIEVAFENMAEGVKKGQLNIAKESLKEDYKMRFLWGEGYIVVNKQIEVLMEKIEGLAKEEEISLMDRTEIITNASHDIRTPLTSIINYIDILKNRDITEAEKLEFIEVLEGKVRRLSVLLEDLKCATDFSIGNVDVIREEVEIIELLNLAIEESKDSIQDKGLELIIDYKIEESKCSIDKNNTMRIFQNLLSNIAKYSLEDSRVYISVEDIKSEKNNYEKQCKITFKNISKEKLNIKPEELIKRFKRGDQSRAESGHGLGLDIVKNLMKSQMGEFELDIEGDLFKVELIFQK